jgi:DeoR family transcriptional regulator, fructose operon transcriptional repressor
MHNSKGLAAERLNQILTMLRSQRVVRVDELSDNLGVSAATVRRDLLRLSHGGAARKVHGGAVAMDGRPEEPLFDDKAASATEQKERIAAAARKFIPNSQSVFLDGGSTVLALARQLVGESKLTVVTNSLRVAALFASGGPRMILTGGEFRGLSQTLVGYLTRPLLEQIRVDIAFIGTIGLTPAEGLTTTDPREAETKELVMSHAKKVIVLADSSKIGISSFVRFGGWNQVDVLITDTGAPREALRTLRRRVDVRTV